LRAAGKRESLEFDSREVISGLGSFAQSLIMGDGVFRAGADEAHDKFGVVKFKSRFYFCIGIRAHKLKIVLNLGQSYLHADTRQQKLRDVTDVGV